MNEDTKNTEAISESLKQRFCQQCKQPIAIDAKVCQHCNRSQNVFWLCLERIGIIGSVLGIIISVLLVALAILQFKEARHERIKAQDASETAIQARQQTKALADEVRMLAQANAELATLTITPAQGNSLEHQEQLIQTRDELLDILHQIGCEDVFITETEKNINDAIEYNLVMGLHRWVQSKHWDDLVGNVVKGHEYEVIMNTPPINFDNLRAFFGTALDGDKQLSEYINALERFTDSKRIITNPNKSSEPILKTPGD